MNTMKKCLALCLTLVLLVSMAACAMAATLKLPAGLTEVEEQAFAGSAALDGTGYGLYCLVLANDLLFKGCGH